MIYISRNNGTIVAGTEKISVEKKPSSCGKTLHDLGDVIVVVETETLEYRILQKDSGWSATPSELQQARTKHIALRRKKQRGLGTWVARTLARVGWTKRRHKRVKYYLGLAPSCGCGVREAQLNRFGLWLRRWILRAVASFRRPDRTARSYKS